MDKKIGGLQERANTEGQSEAAVKEAQEVKSEADVKEQAEMGNVEANSETDAKKQVEAGNAETKTEAETKIETKTDADNAAPKKSSVKRIIIIVVSAILLIIVLAGVIATWVWHKNKVDYYATRCFQNTTINGMDCSELEAAAIAEKLNAQAQEYSLQIVGRDKDGNSVELGVIESGKIGLTLTDALGAAEDVLAAQDETKWYEMLDDVHYSYDVIQGVTFDEELLKQEISSLPAFQKENMLAPTDAYIGEFSEEESAYVLVPETYGNQVDLEKVISCVSATIYGNGASVDLEEQGCYMSPVITTENKELLAKWNTINTWLKTAITYSWNTFEVKLDTSVTKDWVSLVNGEPLLNEEAVAAFVNEYADKYDTFGKTRDFVTTLGVKLTLPTGKFGWRTDREAETAALIELIKQGSVTEREPLYSWKAPWKGLNDIGNSYVEADLTNQHLYLYYKGQLVLETDFVSGDINVPSNMTPQGVFGITYKTLNATLRGADYVTPVNYWMPFHGNFGMHDATWRTEFGGDIFLTDGSHGCLNLPLDKAAEIYNYMCEGFPVICYYY